MVPILRRGAPVWTVTYRELRELGSEFYAVSGGRGGEAPRSFSMEQAFIVIGLVTAIVVVVGLVIAFSRGKGRTPLKTGSETVDRRDRPHAEKEQMNAPQEEFIQDKAPSAPR